MLKTLDKKALTYLPHAGEFDAVRERLGAQRTAEVQAYLDHLIDDLPPDRTTGKRTFNSAYLGSKLAPWGYPLLHLYEVARQIEGPDATEQTVKEHSGRLFGLFIWECMLRRDDENWIVYNPNLSSRDPNREHSGKVYFEE